MPVDLVVVSGAHRGSPKPEFNHKMTRKALWVDGRSNPAWVKARLRLITQGRSQSRACGSVCPVIRHMSGVPKFYNSSLQRVQHQLDAFRDQWRRQKMAAKLYGKEAQSAQREYRGEAEALAGFQGHGNNGRQLETPFRQTRPGAAKWREAAKMIEENRNPSHKVVGGIELRQQTTSSLKVKVERVSDIKAKLTRHIALNGVQEIREPKGLSRDEEEQSSPFTEDVVTENLGKHLITEELRWKAHWMYGRSTPALLDLTGQGGSQSLVGYGNRNWSQVTAEGNGSKGMHSAATAFAVLQNHLQQSTIPDSYAFIKSLQMCSKQKDLFTAKQVHDHIIQSGLDKNPHVAVTLLDVYIKCGALLDARRVFDQLEKKNVVTCNNMIAGYARSGQAECALELFNLMNQEGPEPDEITYLSILKACASPLGLAWGRRLHECIRHAGFESHVRVGTALLQMYAKSGSIDDARLVFDRMEKRDLVTWNIMIGGLAQHGCGHEAYRLFCQMIREGFEPDSVTYLSILNGSASAGALEWVKEVHGHASKVGLESDLRVGNAFIHMYAKSGSIDEAQHVFDIMDKRDAVTWNIMIGGLAQYGRGHESYRLFLQMRREGFEPDAFTFVNILSATASAGALEWLKDIHGYARKAGLEANLRVGTALVHMYAKSGSIDDARLVFDRMEKRDLVTWNTMIGGLAQHGCGHEAYRMFLQMRREGFEPDAFTFTSILTASASAGALEWVKDIHGYARKAGLEADLRVGAALVHMYAKSGSIDDARLVFDRMEKRDVVTWNVMIGGLAQHGCGHEAYRLFLQMRREGFEPDVFTFASILSASASAGALEWVKDIHGYACKAGLEADLRVGAALVHMYAKSGSIDDARLVFDRMEKRDVVTWNVMIGGLAHHGCGHEALALFRKMNADLVKPNGITFVAVLSACCHGGLVDDGRRLFSAMTQDYGIEPEIWQYNCMVDLLGRAGHLEEAERFIRAMPIEPDGVTWTALLGACRTYGNVELGELAAEEVFKLAPDLSSTYVLLSNIYAAAGKWEKVSLVRTMMQKRGVRKEPGRSWIEVDKKVHEFVVGDTCHPEAEAIYTKLNKLTDKLKAEGYIPHTQLVLLDMDEEDKELALCSHSEKLAIAYGLLHIPVEEPIRITKNLRGCPDCHTATKLISKVTGREIIARDAIRFHHFKDGVCSCGDYW